MREDLHGMNTILNKSLCHRLVVGLSFSVWLDINKAEEKLFSKEERKFALSSIIENSFAEGNVFI